MEPGEKLTTAMSAYPADIKSGSGTFLIREVFSRRDDRREKTYRDALKIVESRMRRGRRRTRSTAVKQNPLRKDGKREKNG